MRVLRHILSISIHSLLAEGDNVAVAITQMPHTFQSTPSSQRETGASAAWCRMHPNFNPLPPRRGRRKALDVPEQYGPFQSTPSSQRETGLPSCCLPWRLYFNPLPPRRGRHDAPDATTGVAEFQSTPSSQRETQDYVYPSLPLAISIHSLLAEGDLD